MSFVTPRTNIITIMKNLGYEQLKVAFSDENVGNTKIKKAFHLEQGPIAPDQHSQQVISVTNEMILRFYHTGKRQTSDLVTDALTALNTICDGVFAISNRVNGVSNVMFSGFSMEPLSDQADDIVRGELSITVKQEFDFS